MRANEARTNAAQTGESQFDKALYVGHTFSGRVSDAELRTSAGGGYVRAAAGVAAMADQLSGFAGALAMGAAIF